jgi:hypothetical protein
MSYYEDLTPYNYHHYSERELNVGWLQKDQPFSQGETPVGFLEALRVYGEREHIIFQTKGFHRCEFCEENANSSNEIRVVSKNGILYAAPKMIIHYIEAHKYLPPQEFIDAVMNGPIPGSEEYTNAIRKSVETWQQRRPDMNDEDYEEKMREMMIEELSKNVNAEVMKTVLDQSTDFKKFLEAYSQVMPNVYGMQKKSE